MSSKLPSLHVKALCSRRAGKDESGRNFERDSHEAVQISELGMVGSEDWALRNQDTLGEENVRARALLLQLEAHNDAVLAMDEGRLRHPLPLSIAAGAWGENVLLKGTDSEGRPLDAAAICIGDILEATRGSLRLEVTCPRRPCCKVDQQFGQTWRGAGVRAHTARNGMAGFFCRVLKPGQLAAGDELQVVQRRRPEWSLRRVSDVVYGRTSGRTSVADEASYSIRCLATIENSEEMDLRLALLRELVQVKELADFEWRDKIREMLQLHESRRCLLQ